MAPKKGRRHQVEAVHSWDSPASSWEAADWVGPLEDGSDSAKSDDEPPARELASERLAECIVTEYNQGRMPATLVCSLAHWAKEAGLTGTIRDLALSPGQSSGNYKKHLD
eukprot:2200724-Alexandrium_andersonii.AAC.1